MVSELVDEPFVGHRLEDFVVVIMANCPRKFAEIHRWVVLLLTPELAQLTRVIDAELHRVPIEPADRRRIVARIIQQIQHELP